MLYYTMYQENRNAIYKQCRKYDMCIAFIKGTLIGWLAVLVYAAIVAKKNA